MPKPTRSRSGSTLHSPPPPRIQYEAGRPDRRPLLAETPLAPRLGPYEFQYSVEFGYSSPNPGYQS